MKIVEFYMPGVTRNCWKITPAQHGFYTRWLKEGTEYLHEEFGKVDFPVHVCWKIDIEITYQERLNANSLVKASSIINLLAEAGYIRSSTSSCTGNVTVKPRVEKGVNGWIVKLWFDETNIMNCLSEPKQFNVIQTREMVTNRSKYAYLHKKMSKLLRDKQRGNLTPPSSQQ